MRSSRRSCCAHLKFLSHDLLEGRAPSTRGGDLAAEYLAAQLALVGFEPGAADGTYFQQVAVVESVVDAVVHAACRQRRAVQVSAGRGGLQRRAGRQGVHRRRGGVRGPRHRGARIQVERLRGRGHQGQDRPGDGQRSAGHRRGAAALRGTRADLLRPLDLQVRGGRAPGRGRRHPDPHRRIRHVPVAGGADLVERHAVFAAGAGRASRRCSSRRG